MTVACLVIRMAGMTAVLGLFTGRHIPLSLRAALALAFVAFLSPFLSGVDAAKTGVDVDWPAYLAAATDLLSGSPAAPSSARIPVDVLLYELGFGLLLGAACSAALYAVEIMARWSSRAVFAGFAEGMPDSRRYKAVRSTLYLTIVLSVLSVIASSPAFLALWRYAAESIMATSQQGAAYAPTQFDSSAVVSDVVLRTAGLSLTTALIFTLPMFAAALAVDGLLIPAQRYFARGSLYSFSRSVRIPLLLLVLSLLLYPLSDRIALFLSGTIASGSGEALVHSLNMVP